MKYVTNIFSILNLNELSAEYRLIDIKGLKRNKEFQANQQILIKRLSKFLKHPVTIINRDNEPKLVVKNDPDIIDKIPQEYELVRSSIYLVPTLEIWNLDFVNPDEETKKICLRFLQFDLNGELRKNRNLWQPYAGGPFLLNTPEIMSGVAMYKGFTMRVIELPQGGFGVVIDATRKFASAKPLNTYIIKDQFRKFRKKTFIYKYGWDWYEVQLMECNDLNVSQYKIEGVPLIEYIRTNVAKPHPPLLGNLPNDASVLDYYTYNGDSRGVPAGMCYEVLDFQEINNKEISGKALIPPQERFYEILEYRKKYFENVKFDNALLQVSARSLEVPKQILSFPEFELGNGDILSIRDFKEGERNLPYKIAKARLSRLLNSDIGFYTKTPLPNQFLVLPRSVHDTIGDAFTSSLSEIVNQMYPCDEYAPQVIAYEDKFKQGTDYVELGKHIINAIQSGFTKAKPGYGVVMIPRLEKKNKREHNKLSALIIRELKRLGLHGSIIHTDTVLQCYDLRHDQQGKSYYKVKTEKEKKLNGYLRGVAINKVLLNSNKWPFVLNEPLHADLTIGIDVKHHTAGFTIIDKYGKSIRTELDETSNKEKLSTKQIKAQLYNIVKTEFNLSRDLVIKNIVVHRDGRLFDSELEGLLAGLQQLKDEMILNPDATINVVEIPKSSFLSVRLFSFSWDAKIGKPIIENPNIGLHFYIQNEAFLCSTGKEFFHGGTSNPLYVKYTFGTMPKEEIISDFFKLTTLAFTKPDDCSRFPLSLKMNDRLGDAASEYDEDAYNQLEILKHKLNIDSDE